MERTRALVAFEPAWDEALIWYERAVAEMSGRADTDPTSWSYQAAIHGTRVQGSLASWNSCEHGSWYFFPWHRAYLHAFEDIVRQTVVKLGGPAEWALPYWDYEQQNKDVLPPAFRAETNTDKQTNHLLVKQPLRLQFVNNGVGLKRLLRMLGPRATLSSVEGLKERTFSGPGSDHTHPFGFGGGRSPSSHRGSRFSDIEGCLNSGHSSNPLSILCQSRQPMCSVRRSFTTDTTPSTQVRANSHPTSRIYLLWGVCKTSQTRTQCANFDPLDGLRP
jgi:hypothetical protein